MKSWMHPVFLARPFFSGLWSPVLAGLFWATAGAASPEAVSWKPVGLSGGGGMFTPAVSPADPNLMILNCDMSAAYVSEDGGRNWRMVHQAQLRSDTRCRPAFHPTKPGTVLASSGGRLRISHDRGRTFAPIGDLRDSMPLSPARVCTERWR